MGNNCPWGSEKQEEPRKDEPKMEEPKMEEPKIKTIYIPSKNSAFTWVNGDKTTVKKIIVIINDK
jgi:hypothetical protein